MAYNEIDPNNQHYTWRLSWMSPYESLWSLLNKFAALNCVLLEDVKSIFGKSTRTVTTKHIQYNINKWNLHTLRGFDPAKMCDILNIEMSDLSKSVITTYVKDKAALWIASIPILRFCPICISHGYHSIFHQIYAFKTCPLHHVNIEDRCLRCNSVISYSLNNSRKTIPYSCQYCGNNLWELYSYNGNRLTPNLLTLNDNHTIKLDKLAAIFISSNNKIIYQSNPTILSDRIQSDSSNQNLKSIAHIHSTRLLIYYKCIADDESFNIYKATPKHAIRHIFVWRNNISPICSHLGNGTERQFNNNVISNNDIKSIYKSVRRHIRKKYITITHKHCIIKFISTKRCLIKHTIRCPWAVAYYIWRSYWEQNNRKYLADWYGIMEHSEYNLKWIHLRIFVHDIYWTYQECILAIKSNIINGSYDNLIADININKTKYVTLARKLIYGRLIPYWLVNVSEDGTIRYNWWTRKAFNNHTLNINKDDHQY